MTVQFRLTIRFIAVVLMAGVVLAGVTVYHITDLLVAEVQERVSLDLNSAQAVYNHYTEHIELFLKGAALDPTLAGLLNNSREAEERLKVMRSLCEVDRLYLLDKHGKVVAAINDPHSRDMSANPVVRHALQEKTSVTGTVLTPAQPADSPPADTRPATQDTTSQPALPGSVAGMQMAMASAAPVYGADHEVAGLLYGASILNGRNELVDTIRSEVFQYRFWRGSLTGTATLFQGDLRICTNVRSGNGQRAMGTPMEGKVYQVVLAEGQRLATTAHEVNDLYFTAYEPIRDPDGVVIGALSVGLLKEPFIVSRNRTTGVVVASVTSIASFILILLIVATRQVLRPIEHVVAMTGRVVGGDLSARVGIRPAGELGRLCAAVDRMADAVAEREAQLELATRRQISQSEKLASIGRLAAGVAHEVNNPLTGVLTFTHLLRGKPNLDNQDRIDLDLIIRETTRVRDIVRGLLDFARETPTRKQWLDVNDVIHQETRLLAAQKEFAKIEIEERLAEHVPNVYGDVNQLQQVFLNLTLNACEAMPDGGTLTIISDVRDHEVIVTVADTGHGIRPEDLEKIFEPFFSTKPVGKGTGLGLSVTYGIVRAHGGALGVKSTLGKGTTFTVTLPTEPKEGEMPDGDPEEPSEGKKQGRL